MKRKRKHLCVFTFILGSAVIDGIHYKTRYRACTVKGCKAKRKP